MEDNFITPWNIESEVSQFSLANDNKMSQSFASIAITPLKRFADQYKTQTTQNKKIEGNPLKGNRSDIRIRVPVRDQKLYKQSRSDLKIRDKRMSANLKLESIKLENDQVQIIQPGGKQHARELESSRLLSSPPRISLKLNKSKQAKPSVRLTSRQTKQRNVQRNKMYTRMLKQQQILLNEKMESIFQSQRINNKIQININRAIDNPSQRKIIKPSNYPHHLSHQIYK